MYDPLGGFHRIREQYITYLETAFRISDPDVSAERRALLERPGELCTEALIEPMARYQGVDWKLEQFPDLDPSPVPDLDGRIRRLFTELVTNGLFDRGDVALHQHQVEMLERGTRDGVPGIVTSGTGSGKTEAFLLPVLATILAESASWTPPNDGYLSRRWWHDPDGNPRDKYTQIPQAERPLKANPDADPFELHRAGENRPAAVRCLILYPMNALVEDQLSRLRAALDSPAVRALMRDELDNNRVFFGRYTSEAPVTGFNRHPRRAPLDDYQRRGRKLQELFDRCLDTERTQDRLDKMIENGELSAEDRYLFPSVDGAELVSRWDMQATPPDILISNISMLGAMLNREVDAGIFDATRDWIQSNEDARFHLVLDELHLHRGTAGTEVGYLVRLLLERLGLTDEAHRHKLRILASSASLPVEGEDGARSTQFLWDMFGDHGTATADGRWASLPDAWRDAIVPGVAHSDEPRSTHVLDPAVFEAVISVFGGTAVEPATDRLHPTECSSTWGEVAANLSVEGDISDGSLVSGVIDEVGRRVSLACWSEEDGRVRATKVSTLAGRLFGDETRTDAVRGLLLVRGLGDLFRTWYPESPQPVAPAFRVHTFFRAIEGLYAPADRGDSCDPAHRSESRIFGRLSVERAAGVAGKTNARALDLLYCESCGDLLVGGLRRAQGNKFVELLPSEDNLEGLPEMARTGRFEDLSFDQYAIFWPSDRSDQPESAHQVESWVKCDLDPVTGVTEKGWSGDAERIAGWRYQRTNGQDSHHRNRQSSGTNVPYQCPSCGTDYSARRAEHRLSPVRHFRPGFAKTTQLLASELFELLKIHSDTAKLVSFSDSRQEAARASLDIQARHHEDLRRTILMRELERAVGDRPSPEELSKRLEEIAAERRVAFAADDFARVNELTRLHDELQAAGDATAAPIVPLSDVIDASRDGRYRGPSNSREPLHPLVATYAALGIHPFDPAGIRRIKGTVGSKDRWFEWPELFERSGDDVDWRDHGGDQLLYDSARTALVQEVERSVTEIIFSKTYFSLEETGLGYPCLAPREGETDDDRAIANALLRVFADAYRFADSPYGDHSPQAWIDGQDVNTRVRQFAEEVWGTDAEDNLTAFIERMGNEGHAHGLIQTSRLHVQLVDAEEGAWRCVRCRRVHLHRGVGRCTRCRELLPDDADTTAGSLQQGNFVGRKVVRSDGSVFRLHCEELTGQTDSGPERQRAFRDVLLQDRRPRRNHAGEIIRNDDGEIEYLDSRAFWPEAERIDLLAVTTTMEVGIDIGPLQAVLQANMPPQRFNYQQRVGRAGRRGQAFSMALTVCRTKSHDLYYFREPYKMTGDVPPPPFLARSRPEIAHRFVNKFWLNAAFGHLRSGRTVWPADDMSPPDIHGEFLPTDLFQTDPSWTTDLRGALEATKESASRFAELIADHSVLDVDQILPDVDQLIARLDEAGSRPEVRQPGLAHSLAEAGLLPMYGMPTRVRNLYTGPKWSATGGVDWSVIDRDVDIAIHEFAPGSSIVKDKRTHLCVGFTGALMPASWNDRVDPVSPAFGEPFWMVECPGCNSWIRHDRPIEEAMFCDECSAPLEPARARRCLEPLGFRTDFRPKDRDDTEQTSGRHRSIQAEHSPLSLQPSSGTNLSAAVVPSGRTYRVNRGGFDEDLNGWPGFSARAYTTPTRIGRRQLEVTSQWICTQMSLDTGFTLVDPGSDESDFWLAAPKTTDLIAISPTVVPAGLALDRLLGERSLDGKVGQELLDVMQATAVRAAALSAAFIVVGKAALHMDVDPEEFDIIDPRIAQLAGVRVPVLQFADRLVNGAGLCATLGQTDPASGQSLVGRLVQEIIDDPDEYPLTPFTEARHRDECRGACYRCLLRHSNQSHHGLLDWRLGLAFLGVLRDPAFSCGIDGDDSHPSISDWMSLVESSLRRFSARVPVAQTERLEHTFAFKLGPSTPWAVVVHPLWDVGATTTPFEEAASRIGAGFRTVDSFNLDRRPWKVREALESP